MSRLRRREEKLLSASLETFKKTIRTKEPVEPSETQKKNLSSTNVPVKTKKKGLDSR